MLFISMGLKLWLISEIIHWWCFCYSHCYYLENTIFRQIFRQCITGRGIFWHTKPSFWDLWFCQDYNWRVISWLNLVMAILWLSTSNQSWLCHEQTELASFSCVCPQIQVWTEATLGHYLSWLLCWGTGWAEILTLCWASLTADKPACLLKPSS